MTRTDHLLTIAMEECAEVIQRLSKAQRFTLDERQVDNPIARPTDNPDAKLTNRERIRQEYSHVVAIMELLGITIDVSEMDHKKRKVDKYLQYSAELGTLDGGALIQEPTDDTTLPPISPMARELTKDELIELAYTDPRTRTRSWKDAHKDAHKGNVALTADVERLRDAITTVRQTFDAYLITEVHLYGGIPWESAESHAFRDAVASLLQMMEPPEGTNR